MTLAEQFELLVGKTGRSVREIEQSAGVPVDTLRNILRGVSNDPGVAKVHKLARALGTTLDGIFGDQGGPEEAVELPILFNTGGGPFLPTERYAQTVLGEFPAVPIRNVPISEQWYENLIGESVNRRIPSGSLMHVVSSRATSYYHNNIVIVERSRFGGSLLERTAKVIKFANTGHELWPDSTDPEWQEPIVLNDNLKDETMTAEIVGVVKQAIIRLS